MEMITMRLTSYQGRRNHGDKRTDASLPNCMEGARGAVPFSSKSEEVSHHLLNN